MVVYVGTYTTVEKDLLMTYHVIQSNKNQHFVSLFHVPAPLLELGLEICGPAGQIQFAACF